MRQPDFTNLLQVLDRKTPSRPTLFEFFLNDKLYTRLAGFTVPPNSPISDYYRRATTAYLHAGYDYTTLNVANFSFPTKPHATGASRSMNDTAMISDRPSFNAYPWPDPNTGDYASLKAFLPTLPAGMKAIIWAPCGVLENVISLLGYETLCLLLADDPALVGDIFDAVGSRLLEFYRIVAPLPNVGACIGNDDWGFNSQTMMSPDDMRKYLFPWHKKIVQTIHDAGKPAILHSCGQLDAVMDDIISDLQYDGKHSYEDKICPVEQMYERFHSRIAILGGLDLDFVCRQPPAAIQARGQAMLDRTKTRGSYALGTGNSVPYYVPDENYFAMITPATAIDYPNTYKPLASEPRP